jgi:hypothetical protein
MHNKYNPAEDDALSAKDYDKEEYAPRKYEEEHVPETQPSQQQQLPISAPPPSQKEVPINL